MKTIDSYLQQSGQLLARTGFLLFVAVVFHLLGTGDAQARGARGVGAGARGVGVAPGVGLGAPGVGVAPRPRAVGAAQLPVGYYASVQTGYTVVAYRGYSCRYVGGVYYRPVMYQGQTVWVVVP